jgi:hypothetical protein
LKSARAFVCALLVVLVVGGIPGMRLRSIATPQAAVGRGASHNGELDVVVNEAGDGHRVAQANVRLFVVADDHVYPLASGSTNASGDVHFMNVPPSELWIVVQAPRRARASAHIVSDERKRTVPISLWSGHALTVAVRDELGSSIADSDVEILSSDDPLPAGSRTGPNGTKFVDGLGAGPWQVTARAPGYEDAVVRVQREGTSADLVLRKLGAILVHVAEPEGQDAAGARVSVAGVTLWPARAAEADAHGNVRIGGLAAGSYAMRAVKANLASRIELGVALARGEEKAVSLQLSPGMFANVRVVGGDAPDAEPVGGADVTLAEGGISPFPIEAVTDARGRVRLGPAAPGPSTLGVSAEGFVAKGGVPLAEPWPAEVVLRLIRAGAIAGRVVDAFGEPIGGATIQVVGTDAAGAPIFDDPRRASFRGAHFDAMLSGALPLVWTGELGVVPGPVPPIPGDIGSVDERMRLTSVPYAQTASLEPWITREDGTFVASPASPGRVRVVVRHPQYVEIESEIVALAPGGEANVRVVMHEGGVLEGRVLDANDNPVAGARVFVSATQGSLERSTRAGTDGTFAFAALPDRIALSVVTDVDEAPDVRMTVEIADGERKDLTIRLPEAREPLPIAVLDDRGYPIDAAQVSATSLSLDSPLSATSFTRPDGETAVPRGRGLPLRIEVVAPSHAPAVVTTDGTETSLRVELAAGESVDGDVVTAGEREPIAGATVTIETSRTTKRTRTDAQGHYALADLDSGDARLRVRAPGFAPHAVATTVPERRGRRPHHVERIELESEGIVRGDVVDAMGNPVPGARVARDHVPTWLLVGSNPDDLAITDEKGGFTLRGLAAGMATLEAYAPDLGRGQVSGLAVVAGQTIEGARITLADAESHANPGPSLASGGVALTLAESAASPERISVASVVEGSAAERAGVAPGDVLLQIDGENVVSMDQARAKLNGPIAEDVLLQLQRADRTIVLRVARDEVRR